MWLIYGVDTDNALIAISDVPSGKTHLRCPYCGGPLTAKKGHIVGHHFAHTGETCRAVERTDDVPTLPLYDNFNLQLSGKELKVLREQWQMYGQFNGAAYRDANNDTIFNRLIRRELLQWNKYRDRGLGGYEFTKLGKIPVGALSLALFNEIQEPLISQRLDELEQAATWAWQHNAPILNEKLTDLRIYSAQMRRILAATLYFLEIRADGETLYKIGVTTRPIEARVAELQQQLRAHFLDVTIAVIGTWPHRGNVELYFKHRYHEFRRLIGTQTEYFAFDDSKAVIRDLRRMKPKELTPAERDVLDGKPTAIEQVIATAEKKRRHRQATHDGMKAAAARGIHVGRPEGVEPTAAFLAKPSSQRVISALDAGLSIRAAAREAGVAINTVRKVAALRQHQPAESEH